MKRAAKLVTYFYLIKTQTESLSTMIAAVGLLNDETIPRYDCILTAKAISITNSFGSFNFRLKLDDKRIKKCASTQKNHHCAESTSLSLVDHLTVEQSANRGVTGRHMASKQLTGDDKNPLRRQTNQRETIIAGESSRFQLCAAHRESVNPRAGVSPCDKRATITVDVHHNADFQSGLQRSPLLRTKAPKSAAVNAGATLAVAKETSGGRQWASLETDRAAKVREEVNARRVKSCEERSTAGQRFFIQDPFGITEFITGPGSDDDGETKKLTAREMLYKWSTPKLPVDRSHMRSTIDQSMIRPSIDHTHVRSSSNDRSTTRPAAARLLVRQRSRSDDLQSTMSASRKRNLSAAGASTEHDMRGTRHSLPLSKAYARSSPTIHDMKVTPRIEDMISHRIDGSAAAAVGSRLTFVYQTAAQESSLVPLKSPLVDSNASKRQRWTERVREGETAATTSTSTMTSLEAEALPCTCPDATPHRSTYPHPKASSFDSVPTDYDASESSHCEVTTTSIESTTGSSSTSTSADSKACKLHQMRDDSGYKSLETQQSLGRTAAGAPGTVGAPGVSSGQSSSVDEHRSFVGSVRQSLSETQRSSLTRISILSRQIKQSLRITALRDFPLPVKGTAFVHGGSSADDDNDGSRPQEQHHLSPSPANHRAIIAEMQLRRARSDSRQGTASNLPAQPLPKKSRSEEVADPFQRRRLADQPTVTKTLTKGLSVIRQHAGQYFTSAVSQAEHLLAKVRDHGDGEAADADAMEQGFCLAGRESVGTGKVDDRLRVSLVVEKRQDVLSGSASMNPGEAVEVREDPRGHSADDVETKDTFVSTGMKSAMLSRQTLTPAEGTVVATSHKFRGPTQGRVRALTAEEGDLMGSQSWKSEMNLTEFINRGNGKTASKKRRDYRSRKQVEEIHNSSSVERHLLAPSQLMKEPAATNPDRLQQQQQQQQHRQHVTKNSAKVLPS